MLTRLGQRLNSTVWGRFLPLALKADLHRIAGDRARDNRDWSSAAREYEKYISLRPKQFSLWVQLGNMRKEMGNFSGSRLAYNAAYNLAPDDSDLALQQGHLSKIEGNIEEAHSWYKKAFQLDSNNYHAAEELIALGESTESIRSLLSKSTKVHRKRPREGIAIVIDFTDLLAKASIEAEIDRGSVWFAQLAEEIVKSQSQCLFCIRDYERGAYAILPHEAVVCLTRQIGAQFTRPAEYDLPKHLELCSSDSLLVLTTSAAKAKGFYRRLRSKRDLIVVGVIPPPARLQTGNVFSLNGVDATLLEQASLILTTTCDEADSLRLVSQQHGRLVDIATLVEGPQTYRIQSTMKANAVNALRCVYFASYDFEQLCGIVTAWVKVAPLNATLGIVVENPTQVEIEFISKAAQQHSSIQYLAYDAATLRKALASASCVLIGGVRGQNLLWIQDAIEAGTPVSAGLTPDIFRTWGGLIVEYCDLADVEKAVNRWIGTAISEDDRKQYLIDPLPWTKEANRLVASTLERIASGEIDAQRIDTCVFYSFGAISSSDDIRAGSHLLAGDGWRVAFDSVALIEGPNALLQFCADDHLTKVLCVACPVAFVAGAEVVVRVNVRNGPVIAERTWKAPSMGRGWFIVDYPTNATEGSDTPIVVSFDCRSHVGETGMASPILVGGIFVFPKDLDRYWFEFLEEKADGLLPNLPRQ